MNAFATEPPFQVEQWEGDGSKAIRTLAKCFSFEVSTYVDEAALAKLEHGGPGSRRSKC